MTTARDPEGTARGGAVPILAYPLAIIVLVIAVCVAIMTLLALDQRRLLRAERMVGDYHLASSLHAAKAHEELDLMLRRVLFAEEGDGEELAGDRADRALRRSLHLVNRELERLREIQAGFADDRFTAPLRRVLEARIRLAGAIDSVVALSPSGNESIVEPSRHLQTRLGQLGALHASEHLALHTMEAHAKGWNRLSILSVLVFLSGGALVAVLLLRMRRTIHEQRRTEDELRRSEASLAAAQHMARIGHWEWNVVSGSLSWSDEVFRIFGLEPHEFEETYDAYMRFVHSEDRERLRDAVDRALRGEAPYEIGHRVVRRDGAERNVHERGEVTFGGQGRPLRMVGTVQDVTERVHAEARQKLLRRELDHRVRNNLAAIASLARQAVGTTDSVEEFADGIVGRVTAMARAHEAVARDRWSRADLEELMQLTLAALVPDGDDRLRLEGGPVPLSPDRATALSLTVHELATNAVKHGAWSGPRGRVEVAWSVENDTVVVNWRERGGPAPNPVAARGLGTSLIEGLIRHELGGTTDSNVEAEGLRWRIEFPAKTFDPARDEAVRV